MVDHVATALQKGLVAVLKSSAHLTPLVGGRVYDEPPQKDLVFPYLKINGIDPSAFDTDTTGHHLVQIALEAHSQAPQGRVEATRVAEAVMRTLHRQEAALTVAGWHVVELIYQTQTASRDTSGRGYSARIALQAWLQPAT